MATAPGFMPDAINENIVPGSSDPQITPCGVIEHIAVSNSADIRSIFTDGRGIESHFYVRFDGTIIQYRSIFFEADANFSGNSFGSPRKGFVSVEHEGGFPNGQGTLTKAQLNSFKRIVLWAKSQADFPLRVCPAWDAPGVGYHSLFKEWNPNAHSCPGPDRIKQFHEVIEPWLATALRGPKDSRGHNVDSALSELRHAAKNQPGHSEALLKAIELLKSINPFKWKKK
jgi:hypothetical protein